MNSVVLGGVMVMVLAIGLKVHRFKAESDTNS
jgi:hypothetical protein